MVYITGDTHGDFRRFNTDSFPDQKEMTKDDIVIICGDFGGVWQDTPQERYWLSWLQQKPFTTVFVDGNHENFDRLNSEFETVDFHGGMAHKINDSIYHLMRGYVFTFDDKKFFCFGGAASHDIQDGVLNTNDPDFKRKLFMLSMNPLSRFRINHRSWWAEEMPSDEEYVRGLRTLKENEYYVDFIVTHCAPTNALSMILDHPMEADDLTNYFSSVLARNGLRFRKWYCGHYHVNKQPFREIVVLYDRIERIV